MDPEAGRQAEQGELPEGWQKMRDPTTGEYFFVNHALRQRSKIDPRSAKEYGTAAVGDAEQAVMPAENAVIAGHVPVEFESSQHPHAPNPAALGMNLSDTSLLNGSAQPWGSSRAEPAHLLDHPPDQVFSMNGAPNMSANHSAAFRAAHHGAIGAPLNALDFSVQRNPNGTIHTTGSVSVTPMLGTAVPHAAQVQPGQVDGGSVTHPIYLTTERVTYTAPRGNLDKSYDSRDGKCHVRVSQNAFLQPGKDAGLMQTDKYVSNRSLGRDLYASNRSVSGQHASLDMSYTEQLASTMDPFSSMLQSAEVHSSARPLPQHRQYVTGDHHSFERFQNFVHESTAQSEMREREIERLKHLTMTQAREMAQQREVMGQLQVAHDRSLLQHNELCSRFQALMLDNEKLMLQIRGSSSLLANEGQDYMRESLPRLGLAPHHGSMQSSMRGSDPILLGRDIAAYMPSGCPSNSHLDSRWFMYGEFLSCFLDFPRDERARGRAAESQRERASEQASYGERER